MAGPAGVRLIVLVGLPGAGKSTAGRLAARALGTEFIDLDDLIETTAGQTIPAIFATEGETGFRVRERAATREIAERLVRIPGETEPEAARHRHPVRESRREIEMILAPGGGWIEDPGNRALLGGLSESIYLEVSVAVALARIFASGRSRPMLGGPDPAFRLEEILARRKSLYLQSHHTVSTDSLSASDVASSIVAIARADRGD